MSLIAEKMIHLGNITSKDNILEFGVGTGELAFSYSNAVNNNIFTDINVYMVEITKPKSNLNKKVNLFYALIDGEKIHFIDNSFSVYIERNLPLIYRTIFLSDVTTIKVLTEMKRVSNDRIILIHQNNLSLQQKANDSHHFRKKAKRNEAICIF